MPRRANIDQHRVPMPLRQQRATRSSGTVHVRAPQRPSRRASSEASISAAATISTAAPCKIGRANSRALAAAAGSGS